VVECWTHAKNDERRMTNDEGMIKVPASATMLWRASECGFDSWCLGASLELGARSASLRAGFGILELLRDRHISDEEGSFLSI